MSAIADDTSPALESFDPVKARNLRAAHELLGLVRPCFRLTPRPIGGLVASIRCCVACDLPAVTMGPVNHREFEGMIREKRVGFGCLACLGREAYVYYAQSVLAYFFGSLIADCFEHDLQLAAAMQWLHTLVPPYGALREFQHKHMLAFSSPQRFLVASALHLAASRAHSSDRVRAECFETSAHVWHAL